jgi:hypothetical protein
MTDFSSDGYYHNIVTYDDTLTNLASIDISEGEIVNWQRFKIEIIAHNPANFLEMLTERYDFGCRWNGEFADLISSPITASFSERSSPECDDLAVSISTDGNNILIDVTGIIGQTFYWYIIVSRVIVYIEE